MKYMLELMRQRDIYRLVVYSGFSGRDAWLGSGANLNALDLFNALGSTLLMPSPVEKIYGSYHMNISGSTFINVERDYNVYHNTPVSLTGMHLLSTFVSIDAIHDSADLFSHPKCEPTEMVIEMITTWAATDNALPFIWLSGPPASGKSAISKTLCRHLAGAKRLAASYFFSRHKSRRNTLDMLVPTLAHQLCLRIPEMKAYIQKLLLDDDKIFEKSMEYQFHKMIVEGFSTFKHHIGGLKYIIVIDGLDECAGNMAWTNILQLFVDSVLEHELPILFIISSRPERAITECFDTAPLCHMSLRAVLSDIDSEHGHMSEIFRGPPICITKRQQTLNAAFPRPLPSSWRNARPVAVAHYPHLAPGRTTRRRSEGDLDDSQSCTPPTAPKAPNIRTQSLNSDLSFWRSDLAPSSSNYHPDSTSNTPRAHIIFPEARRMGGGSPRDDGDLEFDNHQPIYHISPFSEEPDSILEPFLINIEGRY